MYTTADYEAQLDALPARSEPEARRLRDLIQRSQHPDWGTPNYCYTCSPQNIGYCRCAIACNE